MRSRAAPAPPAAKGIPATQPTALPAVLTRDQLLEIYYYLRLTRVLEENFVVTMEPGLYFIDSLLEQARADHRGARINWERVDHFKPYGGIRVEDNLAITASGCENLTRDAFAEVSEPPGD